MDTKPCPVKDVLDRLADAWSMLVLRSLGEERKRFTVLLRDIPDISKRMLAKTLRSLEEDGMVTRTVYPTKPPSVEYALTPMGESFMPHLHGLEHWSLSHQEAIHAARDAYRDAA